MPGRNQYPTGADLQAFLLAAGFAEATLAAFDLDLMALSGWEQFNGRANRQMLAVSGTRSFDRPSPANGVLILAEDLASDASVAPSVVDNGVTLMADSQVRFEPLNARGRGTPYNRARFLFWRRWLGNYPYTITPQVTITGSWGYGVTIPEDAWVGMLALAGLGMFSQLVQLQTAGMEMWREADMSESYGGKPLDGLRLGWTSVILATCGGLSDQGKFVYGRYARVPVDGSTGWV